MATGGWRGKGRAGRTVKTKARHGNSSIKEVDTEGSDSPKEGRSSKPSGKTQSRFSPYDTITVSDP